MSYINQYFRYVLINFSFLKHICDKKIQDIFFDESYVTEREKDNPSWDSNHTPSDIRADVLSQLD